MKIFAVYTNIIMKQKPKWFNGFVAKYNPWGLHITLKQASVIADDDIPHLKHVVSQFFDTTQTRPIDIIFEEVQTGNTGDDPILVIAHQADELRTLQGDVCRTLSGFGSYVDPATEEYEKNFRPHITISYGIPAGEYAEKRFIY